MQVFETMRKIVILGTLDTKREEVGFVKELIQARDHEATVVDVGPLGPPLDDPDVSNERIARLAGCNLQDLLRAPRRDQIMEAMGQGAGRCLLDRYEQGGLDGIIGVGGNQGTAIASMAMRMLPIGFPKLIVSTVASGNIRPYIGNKDIVIMFSVADLIGGPNPVSRSILSNAVGALVGMIEYGQRISLGEGERTIAISALGNTEPAVSYAVRSFKKKGFHAISFHASGAGGSAMEELMEAGVIAGVLDLTPHELSEEVVGAGAYVPVRPGRLTVAGRLGIPQVVSLGAIEYLCFGSRESIPHGMRRRKIYMHNPYNANVALSRKEMAKVGRIMAERLNEAKGPTAVFIPAKGWSVYGAEGGPLHDPEGYKVFLRAFQKHLHSRISIKEMDAHINDRLFVDACVDQLHKFMKEARS
jgi:uncharacterized protein (UPF0261 family)